MPVFVWIHGKGFNQGGSGSSNGPHYLVQEDIVFVYVNYRLGALGKQTRHSEILLMAFPLWKHRRSQSS